MSLLSELFASVLEMPGIFTEVAVTNPLAGLMLALGTLFMALSLGYFAVLTLGAVAELFSPGGAGREYPRAR
jgi:hypothetical protein